MATLDALQRGFGLDMLDSGAHRSEAHSAASQGDVRAAGLDFVDATAPTETMRTLENQRKEAVARRQRGKGEEVLARMSDLPLRPRLTRATPEDDADLVAEWLRTTFVGSSLDRRYQPWKTWDAEMSTFMLRHGVPRSDEGDDVLRSHHLNVTVACGEVELATCHQDPSVRLSCVVAMGRKRFDFTSSDCGPKPRFVALCAPAQRACCPCACTHAS
jgi:hypothetical protein